MAKTCVGSTWCRYGVGDSVGFGVELENRYKGIRTPHKMKFGVSGCTRECAEAQGKDVGIIATEKGWNLYVCGNGGMKPRHADLLAADLDRDTLVKYLDRFMMFYIRTADKLTRTAPWLDNMEGGIDYLRAVIIDDNWASTSIWKKRSPACAPSLPANGLKRLTIRPLRFVSNTLSTASSVTRMSRWLPSVHSIVRLRRMNVSQSLWWRKTHEPVGKYLQD
ncbi:nitrite reductase subunit NirD [Kluyvera cryocrescens]|uniref:Nitrite reductase subunit NirD n=1 Tax=Kluyvera cryocrescens TaxID=580 RepID=A0A485ARA1_KLUCR|nr:nitrite reductase subunit NirD [Kluyvera cryocrescens]